MDIFSFPIRFPQNGQTTFTRSIFESEDQLEFAERLKMREEALEARRKGICNGGKSDDDSHQIAGHISTNNASTDSEDVDNQSTSSFSVNETSDEQEDEAEEDIPYDYSDDDPMVDDDADGPGMEESGNLNSETEMNDVQPLGQSQSAAAGNVALVSGQWDSSFEMGSPPQFDEV